MEETKQSQTSPRRGFLVKVASGMAALGLTALASPFKSIAGTPQQKGDKPKGAPAKGVMKSPADAWFDKVKGTHRVVFDATHPHEVMPFAWPKVFLMTNAQTGSAESDCGVVVILRHDAIPYAFQDSMWSKYNFAEVFKAGDIGPAFQAADAATAAKVRNPFWKPALGDFKIPGIGAVDIGITSLQTSGVMFGVCNAAMTVYSAVLAEKMGMKQEDVMKDWMANVIPGVQVVPSGVWALGRAKEHGCAYIFAG